MLSTNLIKSACQPKKILEIKLVLSFFVVVSGAVDGVAKMSARLPGLLMGEDGTNEERGTGELLMLGVGVGLGDFGLKMLAIC